MGRLDRNERKVLRSVERGEWRSAASDKAALKRYVQAARRTLKKNRRVNIRISQGDLEDLQVRAFEEGLPYQTLIASVLHKYVTGLLVPKH
jgi:predicted DNA binding CopG/RHH family protein